MKMKYSHNDKVKIQSTDEQFNNVTGTVVTVFPDLDKELVYTVRYDIPLGSCTKGMFKESDLIPN